MMHGGLLWTCKSQVKWLGTVVNVFQKNNPSLSKGQTTSQEDKTKPLLYKEVKTYPTNKPPTKKRRRRRLVHSKGQK